MDESPDAKVSKPKKSKKKKKRGRSCRKSLPTTISMIASTSEKEKSIERGAPLCSVDDNRDVMYLFFNEIDRRKDMKQTRIKPPLIF